MRPATRKVTKVAAIAVGSLVALAGIAVGAAALYEHQRGDTIADGVTAGGVDLGGMSPAQARAALEASVSTRIQRPIVVTAPGRRYELRRTKLAIKGDAAAAVAEAVRVSKQGNFISRAARDVSGGTLHRRIPLDVGYSRAALTAFVARVATAIDRPAEDAQLHYQTTSLTTVPGKPGRAIDQAALVRRLAHVLRAVHPKPVAVQVHAVPPKVGVAALAAEYPTVITVDRGTKTLRLFEHLKPVHSYTIAVGQAGLETPAGLYHVQDKQVNPSWHVPNSAWAGSLAGQVIPPGPADPIKARWMGIFNGAGIHGTDELSSLGTAASHGCIRMAIPDVISLYNVTPLHAPVYIQ